MLRFSFNNDFLRLNENTSAACANANEASNTLLLTNLQFMPSIMIKRDFFHPKRCYLLSRVHDYMMTTGRS